MKYIRYILFLPFLLALGACSSEIEPDIEQPRTEEDADPDAVSFAATMNGEAEPGNKTDYFKPGDEIRICTPVSYSTPDFSDDEKHYKYKWSATDNTKDYPYQFTPVNDKGFNWRTLQPTSVYYFFEAMYFPGTGHEYYDQIPPDQTLKEDFLKADLLLAHHRVPITQWGDPVQLTFRHAFAMVQVKVTLPEAKDFTPGVFPENAIQEVYMSDMMLRYKVNYAEIISNDGLRTTTGDKTGPTGKVTMYKMEDTEESYQPSDKKGVKLHTYIFRGIVPAQPFKSEHIGDDFLFFKVNTFTSSGVEETLYRFIPNQALSLEASKILNLRLQIEIGEKDATLLKVDILPWGKSTADAIATPEQK